MTNIQYLKEGKSLLRSVIAQRRWLLKHDKGFIQSAFASEECNNIENAVSTIDTAVNMQRYLRRKETVIRFLIPAKNKKRHNELRALLSSELTNNYQPQRSRFQQVSTANAL